MKGDGIMKMCESCGKGVVIGKSGVHKHGGRWWRRAPKTSRVWRANLHKARIKINGNFKTMLLCTKCLRKMKKAQKLVQKSTQPILASPTTV